MLFHIFLYENEGHGAAIIISSPNSYFTELYPKIASRIAVQRHGSSYPYRDSVPHIAINCINRIA